MALRGLTIQLHIHYVIVVDHSPVMASTGTCNRSVRAPSQRNRKFEGAASVPSVLWPVLQNFQPAVYFI